ncbi:thiamine pyrophosphate-dependent enzyme [Terrilactibacillus sp. S3-3]|nr:thiamine pyrophosphate-dependent enzyme [Terrilactibacillus sp. S3-3]
MAEIIKNEPDHAALFVGNSMPVRDLDSFLLNQRKSLLTLANRGANGIDGVVSSALGAGSVIEPLTLVIGDLSFYHDMNGLLAAKLHHLQATIVVINNNGGGIFSFLPQAEEVDDFDALFSTPIGLNIEKVSELYGAAYHQPKSWTAFHKVYQEALSDDRLYIIEVVTEKQENVIKHRSLWAEAAGAARKVLKNHDKKISTLNVVHSVQILGDGPSLLLLHGFTGSKSTWQPFIQKWSQRYRTIAVDIVGHGETAAPDDTSFLYDET